MVTRKSSRPMENPHAFTVCQYGNRLIIHIVMAPRLSRKNLFPGMTGLPVR